jgi:cell fate regulator YaaT (PSP1 superfamily)
MNCSSCTSGDLQIAAGCKQNGGCETGGCNKMNNFDWLSDMEVSLSEAFDAVEIRFKGGKKDFYRNTNNLDITCGDAVIVDVPNGHHMGFVALSGELVRLQMLKKGIENDDNIRQIYRIASPKDVEKYEKIKNREMPTLYRTREIIKDLQLKMKLSDVEYQADNNKATFSYSADERVDFRELIKLLASEFKIRIEMRQISLRQEAGLLGGIGSCGRELCCSTWLTDFKSVTTGAARYQNLSLNPTKLSGQCGRLKCCLNYELETYMEALKDIPSIDGPLLTDRGEAVLQKTDIFRKIMWFSFENENNWHPISAYRVSEILQMNKEGNKPSDLQENIDSKIEIAQAINSDLERLDHKYKNKSRKKSKRRNRNRNKNRFKNNGNK